MNLKDFIHLAGAIQLGIAAANFALPAKLHYRDNLVRVSPIIRQIFVVHAIYIVIVLLGFSAICLFFADDLVGGTAFGTFLSGFLAFFWLLRVIIQIGVYDRDIKKQNALGNAAFISAFLYLGVVFLWAAIHQP